MTITPIGASLIISSAALASGLIGILCAERFEIARVRRSLLTRRWMVWVAISAVMLTAVAGGENVILALFAVLAGVAAFEFRSMLHGSTAGTLISVLAAPAFIVVITRFPADTVTFVFVAFTAILGADIVAARPQAGDAELGEPGPLGAVGPLAIGAALASGPRLAAAFNIGTALLLATLFAVALGDTCAYVAGRTLRGPKLAPRISPAKRWSGVLGNLAGALIAFAAFDLLLPEGIGGPWALLAALIAVAAVLGDLLESALKRQAGVKDAARWLPGFGGLLDRIDSSLLALPAAFLGATALGWAVIL